jgi:GNAT superfamily N-acetyltransferase
LDDRELFDRQYASVRQFCRIMGNASPGAHALELGGVIAAVVPAAPDRSVVNSVAYTRAGELERTLPDLRAAYGTAGVRAWTVWVPREDAAAAQALEAAGHVLDAEPAAMAMELSQLKVPRPDDLDLDPEPDVAAVARLNDLSYTFGGDHFQRALRNAPDLRCYVARVAGRPASCASGYDHEGDFCVAFVATVPEARGRGLAGRLIAHALHDARERGCTTTSLQATSMGHQLYARLGFRDVGPLQMWERRVSVQGTSHA